MMDAKIGSDASSHETQEGAAKKQAPQERDANSDDDSDDAPDPNENQGDSTEQNRLRREKRLAMNRESARARRKRKKILIETLEHQVAELTKSNKKYRIQVSELEKELVVAKQTIQILSRPGNPVAQQPSFSFNQGQQTSHILSSRRAEMEQNDVARRLLQTRNPSVAGQNIAVAGSNVPVTTTADQLLRLERLGVQNISQSVVSRQAPVSAAGTGIESLARPLGDVGTIFGIRGTQNMNLLERPLIGSASVDDALAREQLLMLQQRQSQQVAAPVSDRAALSSDAAARAILLRQLLQEQEFSTKNRNTS